MGGLLKTIGQMARDCILVQDACNLSGVVHSFSSAISDLRKIFPNASTEEINKNPVCVLYSSKISSLTGSENANDFSKAYQWALNHQESEQPSE
jgi:hypothetical protein